VSFSYSSNTDFQLSGSQDADCTPDNHANAYVERDDDDANADVESDDEFKNSRTTSEKSTDSSSDSVPDSETDPDSSSDSKSHECPLPLLQQMFSGNVSHVEQVLTSHKIDRSSTSRKLVKHNGRAVNNTDPPSHFNETGDNAHKQTPNRCHIDALGDKSIVTPNQTLAENNGELRELDDWKCIHGKIAVVLYTLATVQGVDYSPMYVPSILSTLLLLRNEAF